MFGALLFIAAMGEKSLPVYLSVSLNQIAKSYGLSALISFVVLFIVSWFLNCILLYYIGGVLFLSSILAPFVTRLLPKAKITPDGKAVFITGCDSGFGHMLAQRLDDLGFHVFAGCLFPDGDGARTLRKSASSCLHIVTLDVTNGDSVLKAAAYVEENLKENVLWAVVNNAGVNLGGELHWTPLDVIARVVEVNTYGVVRVTKAFLSKLKQSKGRVITVASAAGRYTWPGMVPYCMSKSAAIGFCDGLRLEMYKWDIQVITIEPWMYRTNIVQEEGIRKNIRQTWDSAPKDVRDMYGVDHIEKYTQACLQAINKHATTNPGEVVSLIEEGIMVVCPEYSYSPGAIVDRLSFWLIQRLPKPLGDALVGHAVLGMDISEKFKIM